MDSNPPSISDFLTLLSSMPAGQLILLGLFATTWLIGGNLLVAKHYKRIGRKQLGTPTYPGFPFKSLNKKEWAEFIALAIIAMAFGVAGASYEG